VLEKIKSLVKDGDICVLATVQRETTKFRNLAENPSVSLLIDTREEHQGKKRLESKALTVDGVFQHIEDEVKKTYVRTMLLERHPHLKSFMDHPHAELICIRIASFLFLDGIEDAHFVEL